MHSLSLWISARPLLAYLAASAVLSLVWYAVRGAVWPGVPTANLPVGARVVQAFVEAVLNAPGIVRAALGTGGAPPGAKS